jgi:hypothetical protein
MDFVSKKTYISLTDRKSSQPSGGEMPLYEVMLLGEGAPEVRLTDRALALGDLVEIAQRLWRVERSMAASREDAERRFLLVLDEADALPV